MASLYQPLDVAKQQIRLIRVLPSKQSSEQIECTLQLASLLDELVYEALSYCWGSTADPVNILIDGHERSATRNLAAALEHFREKGDALDIPMWIDAICINQDDVAERSAQVAMMGLLYQRATAVHIWLGGSDLVDKASMRALEAFMASSNEDPNQTWSKSLDKKDLAILKDLSKLTKNPYWTRTWILQEVFGASKIFAHGDGERVQLQCRPGGRSVFVEIYNRIPRRQQRVLVDKGYATPASELELEIYEHCLPLEEAFEPMAMADWMSRAAILIADGQTAFLRIPQVMFLTFRLSLATDPRDKVYGMLGLLGGILNITPDYSKTAGEVYTQTTLQLMDLARDFEVLSQACSNNLDLPSWVPDFSVPSRFPKYFCKFLNGCAAGSDEQMTKSVTSPGTLCTKGLHLDGSIVHIARGVQGHAALIDKLRCLQKWRALFLKHAMMFMLENTTPVMREHVLWRAICGGALNAVELEADDIVRIQSLFDHSLVAKSQDDEDILDHISNVLTDCDFFIAGDGCAGLVPRESIEIGDCILILAGGPTPFCARRLSDANSRTYTLRGPCYVENHIVVESRSDQNLMYGKAVMARREREGHRTFDDIFLM